MQYYYKDSVMLSLMKSTAYQLTSSKHFSQESSSRFTICSDMSLHVFNCSHIVCYR